GNNRSSSPRSSAPRSVRLDPHTDYLLSIRRTGEDHLRTTRLAAAAVVIGSGVALHVVSASAQTARDVKGPELARALRAQKRENLMYFKAVDVAGVRLFYREAGDPSK